MWRTLMWRGRVVAQVADKALRELAQVAFMDVVAAYEILGDPDKRAAYDDMGGKDQVLLVSSGRQTAERFERQSGSWKERSMG